MTREEATALLKSRVDLIKSNYPEIDDYCEALEMAIEALKQEPCEDCISRTQAQRAIEINACRYTLTNECGDIDKVEWDSRLIDIDDAVSIIRILPSVIPQEPCEGWRFYYRHGYAQAKLEQGAVLDKIRTEIANIYCGQYCENPLTADAVREMALEIIDKYKAESESKG